MLGWQLNMSTLDALSGAKLLIFLHIPKEFSQNLILSLDLKAFRSISFPLYHYHDRIFCISDDGRNRGGTFYTMNQAERLKVPVVNVY